MSARLSTALFLTAMFAAAGVSMAFLPLWLVACGLTPAAVAQVLGLAAILRLAATPAWGWLADRVGSLRLVLVLAAAGSTAATLGWLPARGFEAVLAVTLLQGFAAAALLPLMDTLCMALAREGRVEYGRIRSAGSAAFMAATALAGPVVAAAGPVAAPMLMAVCYALATAIGPFLPGTRAVPKVPGPAGGVRLLRHRPFLLTIAASALIQGSHAAYYALSTLHWRAQGLSDTAIGLLWAEGVVVETALFFWSRRLTGRIGPAGLTALAGGAALLRWTVTGLTTELAALVAVQALHAATYGLQHLSAMRMLGETVPPDRAATAQTLHAALGNVAPIGLLMWVCGILYDESGRVFLAMAVLGGAGLLLAPLLRSGQGDEVLQQPSRMRR